MIPLTSTSSTYSESAIKILKGLEPVKQRPGMYTRTDNPLHIVQEVIDNACDEALAGHGKLISVSLNPDLSITVKDQGRGIPCGIHPEEGVSVLEIVFTRLHAGGKFDKNNGSAYSFAGGLHGVGVSVTNALSTRLEATVWRDNQCHQLVFSGGDIIEPLTTRPRNTDKHRNEPKHGTQVQVWPDARYFDSHTVPVAELARLLRSKAVLLSGVTFALTTFNGNGEPNTQTWLYENGMRGYLASELLSDPLIPYWGEQHFMPEGHETFAHGEGAQWLIAWTAEGSVIRESYVNLIHTAAGGTHESGLKEGLFNAVKSFCELHKLLPKGIKLLPDDVFCRVSFVLSTKILDPQFQGQTKERLNTRDAVRLVSTCIKSAFELWLNQHLEHGKTLAELCIRQAQNRSRAAQKVEKRKSSSVAVLPGKLTDCESTDIERNEIFLVEGDSAGGSAKMGRDKHTQAVLPLRGKVLNTWEVDKDRLFANTEIHDIAVALGIDPHLPYNPDEPITHIDFSTLRYGKVCILSDADVDGSHIQVLLLTLFYKHFPQLIERGHIYVSQPPLFRVDAPTKGKKPAQKHYCLDEFERQTVIDKLHKEGFNDTALSISRFKGLGEMTPEQLWDTTLNPDTRRLLCMKVINPTVNHPAMFHKLMAKSESPARKTWLEEHGNQVAVEV